MHYTGIHQCIIGSVFCFDLYSLSVLLRRINSGITSNIWQLSWLLCTSSWRHRPTVTRFVVKAEDCNATQRSRFDTKPGLGVAVQCEYVRELFLCIWIVFFLIYLEQRVVKVPVTN